MTCGMVKSELQLGCDGPCDDNRQVRGLAPMHHALMKNKWRLGAKGAEESNRSHRRNGARSEQEYMEGEIVIKTAPIKSRRKAIASSSRLPVRWEQERLEGVKPWRRPNTC